MIKTQSLPLQRLPYAKLLEQVSKYGAEIRFDPEMHAYRKLEQCLTVSNRRVDQNILNLVLSGTIWGTVNGNRIELNPGGLFWISPGVPHTLNYSADLVFYFMRFDFFRNNLRLVPQKGLLVLPHAFDLQYTVQHIIQELEVSLPFHSTRLKALFLLLFAEILRMRELGTDTNKTRVFSHSQQTRIIQYAVDRMCRGITPIQMANELDLSGQYFSRTFKQTFGISPRSWLVQERMRIAAIKLLETEKRISSIAYEFGYESVYFFSRQFKQIFGMSPALYRKKNILA